MDFSADKTMSLDFLKEHLTAFGACVEENQEDDVLKKLRLATADGVGASGRVSAVRVQTVLRHAREVLQSYERSHGTDDFLNDTFQACDMKCFEFEVNRFSSWSHHTKSKLNFLIRKIPLRLTPG